MRDGIDLATPIAGVCLGLTGPTTVSVCDDGVGDGEPTPGVIELADLPAGDYVIDALPPEGGSSRGITRTR